MEIRTLTLVFIAILSMGIQTGQGQVYSWIDDQGIRHYSNVTPPQNGAARSLEETRPAPASGDFQLVKVYDGDTILARALGIEFKIRLVGIDAPEKGYSKGPAQPFAREADQYLTRRLATHSFGVKSYGMGSYNRILGEIYLNGKNLNLELVSRGLAQVYAGKTAPGLDMAPYHRAQDIARTARRGIWSLEKNYIPPEKWRRRHPRTP